MCQSPLKLQVFAPQSGITLGSQAHAAEGTYSFASMAAAPIAQIAITQPRSFCAFSREMNDIASKLMKKG
jgi:hypothetical protein